MNKSQKSDIDAIVWWIPIKSVRDAIRNIYIEISFTSFYQNHHD